MEVLHDVHKVNMMKISAQWYFIVKMFSIRNPFIQLFSWIGGEKDKWGLSRKSSSLSSFLVDIGNANSSPDYEK